MARISIITIAYNSEKTISRTIESVYNQTYQPYEYIIVDGLSKDSTVEVAKQYEQKFKEKGMIYRIISERDKGLYDAMNKGITMAEGELIGMINSDDWYEPDALKEVNEAYEKEHFDTSFANINLIKQNGTVILKKARLRKYKTTRDWNHPTMFVRKDIYNDIKYDNSNVYADYDVFLKIAGRGYKIVTIDKTLANFMVGGVSNEKSFSGVMKRIKLRYGNYRKNGFSWLYIVESVFMELAKVIIA